MADEEKDFYLEIRDSYFDRLRLLDQEISKKRIRTYQALAAEILGFFTFVKLFSSLDLRKTKIGNRFTYNLLDIAAWELVAFVIAGFFLAILIIYKIEKPGDWHVPAVTLDGVDATENPIDVSRLIQSYLLDLEQDVLSDEEKMEDLKKNYSNLQVIVVIQLIIFGLTGSIFLLYWLFTRF